MNKHKRALLHRFLFYLIYAIFNLMKKLIYQKETKERLDKFLASEFTDWSRSKLQRLIHEGQITVNGQIVVKHYQLKMNDKIVLNESPRHNPGQTKNHIIKKSYNQINPEVIDKTDNYLMINKPAGLIVHPAEGVREKTLIDWLTEKYPEIKNIGDDSQRPGIVHRLDKAVSGVMVVALTQKMFDHLKKQFQNHQIKKEYLALVYGKIKSDEGAINFPLERSRISGKMAARPKGNEGREAITNFVVLKRFSR